MVRTDWHRTEIAVCDFIQSKLRTPKRMMVSFDEYASMMVPVSKLHYGRRGNLALTSFAEFNADPTFVHHDPDDWSTRGVSLMPSVDCDTYDIPGYAVSDYRQYDSHEGVPYIESAAAYDAAKGELNVFVINLNREQDTTLELDVRGFEGFDFIEQPQLYTDDLNAANSFENPNVIVPSVGSAAKFEIGKVSAVAKKLSWNVFRFKKQ